MDGVRQTCGARRVAAKCMYRTGRIPRFLKQFTTARLLRRLAPFDGAGRQFPGELLNGGPELADDRKLSVGRTRDDRNIIALGDRMIQLGGAARSKRDAALNDVHPRRNVSRAAANDLRQGHYSCLSIQVTGWRRTVSAGRRR